MAGLIHTIIGHEQTKQWLLTSAQNDHLPSTMILQGPQGIGKATLVRALLQVFNCPNEELACGTCSFCRRSLEEKNEIIFELKPESKKVITVDQVRDMHQQLSLKVMHKARFVLIDPADKLTTQAANSLLKVLEEAPPQTYFFLITDRVSSLLPTIRSRSHILNLTALTQEELASYGSFDPVAIEWADGRLSLAIELQEEESIEHLNESLQLLYSLACETPQDWKKKAPWFFNSDRWREFNFNIWKQAIAKRLFEQNQDLAFLPSDSGSLSALYEVLESLKNDVAANVDKQLALENFYYQIRSKGIMNERAAH